MFKTLASAATLGLCLISGAALAQSLPEETLIDWRMVQSESQLEEREVTLMLRRISGEHGWSNTSRSYPTDMLLGFDPTLLGAPERVLTSFTLAGDAGALKCEGSVRDGTGSGECAFDPDRDFADSLVALGLERPREQELYQLLLAGVDLDDVAKIERWGLGKPNLDDLMAFAVHEVDDGFVQDLLSAGLMPDRLDELVASRIHGVSSDYVRDILVLGPRFEHLDGDDYLAFRIHGVTPDFIRQIDAFGMGGLTANDFVALRIHGVTPDYINKVRAMGSEFETLSGSEIVAFAIHCVNGDDIEAFAALGYTDLSPSKLVEFRIHGVTPGYVRQFSEKGLPMPSPNRLVQMKISGFDPGRIDGP